eukprot:c20351_g1_i2.p1 GENE.c20351_g1_i2~~c20351_g1_i2.p1  ORF type:complete len:623 (+),score=210.48 c20351_g1_i2:32-1870(+)
MFSFCRKDKEDEIKIVPFVPKLITREIQFDGIMEITIIEGRDLLIKDSLSHSSDPFVTIEWGGDTRRTKAITANRKDPKWEQKCLFRVKQDQKDWKIQLVVWDKDLVSENDLMGCVEIPFNCIDKTMDIWVQLQNKKIYDQNEGKFAGFIHLKIELLSKEKVEVEFWKYFVRLVDANGDGVITTEELSYLLSSCSTETVENELKSKEIIAKISKESSKNQCTTDELANFFTSKENTFVQLKCNPITLEKLPENQTEAVYELYCQMDRELNQHLSSGWVTPEEASHGWFLGLTEWALPGDRYTVQNKPSLVNKILVQDRQSGLINEEFIPSAVSLALRSMYQNKVSKMIFDDGKMLSELSHKMGIKYSKPESIKNIEPFIKTYGIDMREALLDISEFKTFNEFFYRKLKPSSRPIHQKDDNKIAISAADCRLLVFDNCDEAKRIWIKGKLFSIDSMLQGLNSAIFNQSSMAIFRLAPQDYHRVHFPVSGKVTKIYPIPGKLFTVNPIAVREEDVNVFTENKRTLLFLESEEFGSVCMVIIGATVVGSIVINVKEGDIVSKGDECNYFAYGGSTVITLFQKGKIRFDEDLVERSLKPLETHILMGDSLGRACST